MIELRAPGVTCAIDAEHGGRIAQLTVGGRELLVGLEPGIDPNAMSWGSFPMVPWAGRIADGRFHFAGNQYQMQINLAPHAIHGTAFVVPWMVHTADGASVTMSSALTSPWPFGGTAHQHIALGEHTLTCRLGVTADDLPMPVQVGWHPWFVTPDAAEISFAHMYRRDDRHIPTGEIVESPVGPWDDCFVEPLATPSLTFGNIVVTVDSDCTHWVVFDQLAHATCVEPQSGPPDGFNALPRRGAAEPFTALAPHETFERTMTIAWSTR